MWLQGDVCVSLTVLCCIQLIPTCNKVKVQTLYSARLGKVTLDMTGKRRIVVDCTVRTVEKISPKWESQSDQWNLFKAEQNWRLSFVDVALQLFNQEMINNGTSVFFFLFFFQRWHLRSENLKKRENGENPGFVNKFFFLSKKSCNSGGGGKVSFELFEGYVIHKEYEKNHDYSSLKAMFSEENCAKRFSWRGTNSIELTHQFLIFLQVTVTEEI